MAHFGHAGIFGCFCLSVFLFGTFSAVAFCSAPKRWLVKFREGGDGVFGIGRCVEIFEQCRSGVAVGDYFARGLYCGVDRDLFAVWFLFVGQDPLAARFCAGYDWSAAFAGE